MTTHSKLEKKLPISKLNFKAFPLTTICVNEFSNVPHGCQPN